MPCQRMIHPIIYAGVYILFFDFFFPTFSSGLDWGWCKHTYIELELLATNTNTRTNTDAMEYFFSI